MPSTILLLFCYLQVTKTIIILLVGGLCFLLVPAAIFAYLQNWSYGTAIYYGIVTLTSIGFGDYVAGIEARI